MKPVGQTVEFANVAKPGVNLALRRDRMIKIILSFGDFELRIEVPYQALVAFAAIIRVL